MRSIVVVLPMLTFAASASSQTPSQPNAWSFGQTSEYCYLRKSIGAGAQKADVLIQAFGSGSPYHVAIRSATIPLRPQRADVAKISFGSPLALQDTFVILGKWNDLGTAVFAASPHSVRMNGEIYVYQSTDARTLAPIDPSGEVLSIEMPDMEPMTLQLGTMSGEYERLDSCVEGLESKWRAAASAGAVIAREPELQHPGEANWHMKYPENMLLNLISGIAEIRMTVDQKGRARDCVVQVSTWASRFGEDSCAALKRVARFEPARDAEGNPVSALFQTSIIFINYKWS